MTLDASAIVVEPDRSRKAARMQYLAQQFRVEVLDILHEKGTGHWGGAASAAELLASLYFDILRIRPDQPDWPDRDRLVVSKGHASCMLYTMLAHRGFFPVEELSTFRDLDSRLQGHPCMNKTPGVEMSTGALGHGMSVTLGMALAARLQGRDYWSYVLVGDGDLNEGQTWEGIMAAAKFKPERLVVLVDYNKVQLDGPSDEIMPMDPLADKFRAFNWNVAPRSYDGHSVADILESFDWVRGQDEWPVVVIYRTHKGRGVSFMEDNHLWHGAPIDDDTHAKARTELLSTLRELEKAL
ncbi:MAG TPA: transketolase [Planctomycetaceae bacterium]|nr:transketolase [Planctomycetaceae bacterium]